MNITKNLFVGLLAVAIVTLSVGAYHATGYVLNEMESTKNLPAQLSIPSSQPLAAQSLAKKSGAPNIIYIMLDDVGYGDFLEPSNYIPNIRKFAAGGLTFERFYVHPTCSPTRAAILSGYNPIKYNIHRAINGTTDLGLPGGLVTLPEMLRDVGYTTMHIGKWHLGDQSKQFLPNQQGFEYSYSSFGNERIDPLIHEDNATSPTLVSGYKVEVLTDKAIEKINDYAAGPQDEPLFLNMWYNAPHKEWEASPYWHSKFPNTPRGEFQAILAHTDEQIGRLLDALETSGVLQNSIVMITADNGLGGFHNTVSGLSGGKGSLLEGGIREPLYVQWPGHTKPGTKDTTVIAARDLWNTLAEITGVPKTTIVGTDGETVQTHLDRRIAQDSSSFADILLGQSNNRKRPSTIFAGQKSDPTKNQAEQFMLLDNDLKLYLDENAVAHLYDLSNDPSESNDLASKMPQVRDSMVQQIIDQKIKLTRIPSAVKTTKGAVQENSNTFVFSGPGMAEFEHRIQYSFDNAMFTMAATIQPDEIVSPGVQNIIYKHGSWSMYLKNGDLTLNFVDPIKGTQVLAGGYTLQPHTEYDIAFTVEANVNAANDVRLYIRKANANEQFSEVATAKVNRVVEKGSPIRVGAQPALTRPFLGTIKNPQFFVSELEPSELDLIF